MGFHQNIWLKLSDVMVGNKLYHFMTLHDYLTNLPNRNFLNQYANNLLKDAEKTHICFLYINLDRFKLINNVFGYHHADKLLSSIAKRLIFIMQDKMSLYRISGDELLMIIEDSNQKQAQYWAEIILEELKKPFLIEDKNIYITSSIGISYSPDHGTTLQELLICADTAMTQAKKQGRNTYHCYNVDFPYIGKQFNLNLLNDLYAEDTLNQFVLYYQPKFEVENLAISGVEALIRWQHPEHGLLLPKDFIEMSEKSGSIIPMTYWLLEESCRQAQQWRAEGKTHFLPISINISSLVFEQENLLLHTERFLEQYQIEASDLVFEITESTAMKNLQKSHQVCKYLSALGIHIAIDDFGVGYSNFLYLKDLTVSELKIDRIFLRDLEHEDEKEANKSRIILAHMLQLAKHLELVATVEGVENLEQLRLLSKLDCQYVQGFYLAKPMSKEKLEERFTDAMSLFKHLDMS